MHNQSMTSSAVSVAVILTLLISVCGKQADTDINQWYSYAHSPEATASANATLELNKLPPDQRTPSTAVKLCHKQDGDNFCAWIAVDDSGRPVAVSCFNELHRQCNRRERLLTEGGTPSKFRETDCELCSPCVDGNWDSCPDCRRACYCTCDHYRHAGGTEFNRDGSTQIYQCHEFCDGRRQCKNEQDEGAGSCKFYKLAGSPPPDPVRATITNLLTSCMILLVLLLFGAGLLFCKYRKYQSMMHRSGTQQQPTWPIAPPPPSSYPHQDPLLPSQRTQDFANYPPPPPYEDVK